MGPVSWQIQLYPNLQTQVPQHQARRPVQSQEDQVKESPVNILPSSCIYISLKMFCSRILQLGSFLEPSLSPWVPPYCGLQYASLLVAIHGPRYPRLCGFLHSVCSEQIIASTLVWFTPNPGDADVPLVPYCTRFSYRPHPQVTLAF